MRKKSIFCLIVASLLLLFVAFLAGAGQAPYIHVQYSKDINESIDKSVRTSVRVIKVDNCQYVVYEGLRCVAMVHKENCVNPIHKKEQEELLNTIRFCGNIVEKPVHKK
jgi:uncharacterized sodium:solute symporter family permease YidK